MKFLFIVLSVVLGMSQSWAYQPQEGLYYNPDASGRGVAIEVREGTTVATYFGYRSSGLPQWWQGVLSETSDDMWEGDFAAFENGQCFGCSYQAPEIDYANVLYGTKIEFLGNEKLRFTWPGGSDVLAKQNWGYFNDLDYAFGLWAISAYDGNLEAKVSHSIVFWGETGEGNDRIILGNVSGYQGSNSRVAVATDSGEGAHDGVVYMMVDISSTRNVLYKFNTSKTTLDGGAVLLDKNNNAIASYTGVAKRVFSGYEIGVGGKSNNKALKSAMGGSLDDLLKDIDLDVIYRLSEQIRTFDNM